MPVLFAAAITIIIGMAGLVIDFGFATLERRVLQNAADAGALTGASDLVRGVTPTADVQTMATQNGAAVTAVVGCEYVDNGDAVTGPCSSPPSTSASGVRVTATNTRPTYFIRVLGIPTFTVSASSTARVAAWTSNTPYNVGNSLFLVCGYNTRLAGPGNHTMNILEGVQPGTSPWNVNPAAVGREFVIHDPHVADCGMQSSSFKGLNASSGVFTLPRTLISETGTRAGPTAEAVKTHGGCASGLYSDNVNDCVMIIPIFVSSPEKNEAYSVRWLPFRVRQIDSNTHYGRLLDSITLQQETWALLAPWTKNTKSAMTSVRTVR